MSTYLITGGTGSFGKTMLMSLLNSDVDEIRILSRDEEKQDALRRQLNDPRVKFYIGDIRDRSTLKRAFKGVDFLFHAAALKQVPSCEFFPIEAVKTNILGSDNVINEAVDAGVRRVVCLSTDKAVEPINAMGMSKAMMEKLVSAHARTDTSSDTVVSAVRYGNVMYSRGSVIPHFIRQIRNGEPLTVTDPAMTRFLLSLPQTVALVNFAFERANNGDTFIMKAPACTIHTLALALLDLFGQPTTKADGSPNYIEIGTRHSEKLYESLASKAELEYSEDLGDYIRIPCDTRDLNYDKYFAEGTQHKEEIDSYHSHNTHRLDVEDTKKVLMELKEVRDELESFQKAAAEAG